MDRRRRAKRAERHAAANRAAAEERRAAAAQRAVAEERRAAAAVAAADEERRAAAAAAQGAAADEPEDAAAVDEPEDAAAVAAPLPARQAVPARAAPERQSPTCKQMYKSCWGKPNTNRVADDKLKGRQGLPLPANAPGIEDQFFQLKKKNKTGNALVDLLLAEMYDDVYNDIGDTRREILHSISRKDKVLELRLSCQLAGLMEKANAICLTPPDT